jgi:UDP-glucose 4-epimerase
VLGGHVSILVTGAAGYIGSVVVDELIDRGEHVVVLDDLSGGHRDAVNTSAVWQEGSVGDVELVHSLVAHHGISVCIHFAGLIAVGESVREPRLYLDVNVGQSLSLIGALIDSGVTSIVFSSSAAVYGDPEVVPIPEDHRHEPTSPYGVAKMMVERALKEYDRANLVRSVSLRYFNAAGATDRRAERHDPETHLIPLALDAALGLRGPLTIYGNDYPTPDGTPIRDYVHVADLALAHLAAVDYLAGGGTTMAANLGTGNGYSVLDVIESVERASGHAVPTTAGPRRIGDPASLVAGVGAARERLGWKPKMIDLDEIVTMAYRSRR